LLGRKAPTRLPRLLASGRRRQTRSSTASGSCSSWTWSVFAPRSSWQSVTGVPTTSNSGGAQRFRLHPASGASSGKVCRELFCKSWQGGLFREAAAVVGVPRGTVRDRGGGVFAGPNFGDTGTMSIGQRAFLARSDESPAKRTRVVGGNDETGHVKPFQDFDRTLVVPSTTHVQTHMCMCMHMTCTFLRPSSCFTFLSWTFPLLAQQRGPAPWGTYHSSRISSIGSASLKVLDRGHQERVVGGSAPYGPRRLIRPLRRHCRPAH